MIAFQRHMGSHLEIDSEEQEALKDMSYSTSDVHPSDNQREPVDLSRYVIMTRDATVIRERLARPRETLPEGEKHVVPCRLSRKV